MGKTALIRPYIVLDEYIVMPNHVHGIIMIDGDGVGATRRVAPTDHVPPKGPIYGSIGAVIGQFKSQVSRHINVMNGTSGYPVWQRNYYEHVIRNDLDMQRIQEYIISNPFQWEYDVENPLNRDHSSCNYLHSRRPI